MEKVEPRAKSSGAPAEIQDLHQTLVELQSRIGDLYGKVMASTGRPTADQQAQMEYFPGLIRTLEGQVRAAGGS
jgi:hypothetical protein